eukprot:15182964-Alexandrium_andersonii.AAC.1
MQRKGEKQTPPARRQLLQSPPVPNPEWQTVQLRRRPLRAACLAPCPGTRALVLSWPPCPRTPVLG